MSRNLRQIVCGASSPLRLSLFFLFVRRVAISQETRNAGKYLVRKHRVCGWVLCTAKWQCSKSWPDFRTVNYLYKCMLACCRWRADRKVSFPCKGNGICGNLSAKVEGCLCVCSIREELSNVVSFGGFSTA